MTEEQPPHLQDSPRPSGPPPPPSKEKLAKPSGEKPRPAGPQLPQDPAFAMVQSFFELCKMEANLDAPKTFKVYSADGEAHDFDVTSRPLMVGEMVKREFESMGYNLDELATRDAVAQRHLRDANVKLNAGDLEGAEAIAKLVRDASSEDYKKNQDRRIDAYVRIFQLLVAPVGKKPDLKKSELTREMVLWGLPWSEATKALTAFYIRDCVMPRSREKKILLSER